MDRSFGSQTELPTEEAIRKKSKRPLLPWWRSKSAPDTRAAKSDKVVTPENQTNAGKPEKRRPKLSLLTSPPPDLRRSDKPRHTRSGSTVRILSPGRNKSTPCLHDGVEFPPMPPLPPLPAHAQTSILQSPGGLGAGPGGSLLLPALEPAPPVKSRPSRTSLKKKASQVFEFSKASVASLRTLAHRGDR